MFSIRIWNCGSFNYKLVCIKLNNCGRTVICHLASEEELNSVITPFVLYSVFRNVGLLCIIENNKHNKFKWVYKTLNLQRKFHDIIQTFAQN